MSWLCRVPQLLLGEYCIQLTQQKRTITTRVLQSSLQLPPTILQEMEAELQEITDRMAVHYLQVTSFYNSETCDYSSMILIDYLKLENFTDYMAIWIKG